MHARGEHASCTQKDPSWDSNQGLINIRVLTTAQPPKSTQEYKMIINKPSRIFAFLCDFSTCWTMDQPPVLTSVPAAYDTSAFT